MNVYFVKKGFAYNSSKNKKNKNIQKGLLKNTFLRFPVLPSEYELASEHNNQSVDINTYGEVALLGKRKLKTLSLSSFFPAKKQTFTTGAYQIKPQEYVKTIEYFKDHAPFRCVITGSRSVNMLCTIESFAWGENDGTGDITFSVDLKEYRKPTVKKVKKKSKKGKKTKVSSKKASKTSKKIMKGSITRSSKSVTSMTYTVKKGDTLPKIAKKCTGSSANYRAIANQNGIANPTNIKAGQRLVIKV